MLKRMLGLSSSNAEKKNGWILDPPTSARSLPVEPTGRKEFFQLAS